MGTVSGSASGSGSGGNAKYLRYVRSKLSKSRLNSVLSLTSSSAKESAQNQSLTTQSECLSQQVEQVNGSSSSSSNVRQQLAASGFQSELKRLERQQHLVSGDNNNNNNSGSGSGLEQAMEVLTKQSQQQQLRLEVHKQVVGSLSSEILMNSSKVDNILSSGGAQEFLSSASSQNSLPPIGTPPALGSSKSTFSQSVKKSNFFQGFRYTLRGRRGSKQIQQQEKVDNLNSENNEDVDATLQQSHSLTSISNNQPGQMRTSIKCSTKVGGSKKLRHKLLHSVNLSSSSTCQNQENQCDSQWKELESNSPLQIDFIRRNQDDCDLESNSNNSSIKSYETTLINEKNESFVIEQQTVCSSKVVSSSTSYASSSSTSLTDRSRKSEQKERIN